MPKMTSLSMAGSPLPKLPEPEPEPRRVSDVGGVRPSEGSDSGSWKRRVSYYGSSEEEQENIRNHKGRVGPHNFSFRNDKRKKKEYNG